MKKQSIKKGELIKKGEDSILPSYIKNNTTRGSENVAPSDLIIPRLILLQKMSPQLNKNDPSYINNVCDGDFLNSLTKCSYKPPINIISIYYRKDYTIFKKRIKGGGFRGIFKDFETAINHIETQEDKEDLEVIETGNHFCFLPETREEIVLSMSSTKLRISRIFNSLIRMRGKLDRWAGKYLLSSQLENNDKGSFWNFGISNNGWTNKEDYAICESIYLNIIKRSIDPQNNSTDVQDKGEDIPF